MWILEINECAWTLKEHNILRNAHIFNVKRYNYAYGCTYVLYVVLFFRLLLTLSRSTGTRMFLFFTLFNVKKRCSIKFALIIIIFVQRFSITFLRPKRVSNFMATLFNGAEFIYWFIYSFKRINEVLRKHMLPAWIHVHTFMYAWVTCIENFIVFFDNFSHVKIGK